MLLEVTKKIDGLVYRENIVFTNEFVDLTKTILATALDKGELTVEFPVFKSENLKPLFLPLAILSNTMGVNVEDSILLKKAKKGFQIIGKEEKTFSFKNLLLLTIELHKNTYTALDLFKYFNKLLSFLEERDLPKAFNLLFSGEKYPFSLLQPLDKYRIMYDERLLALFYWFFTEQVEPTKKTLTEAILLRFFTEDRLVSYLRRRLAKKPKGTYNLLREYFSDEIRSKCTIKR